MAVDSFKSITQSFKGTGLKAIIDDITVTKYATSIKGLTLEQANLALSTTQLSATEKERVLVEAGLIAQTETLTATDAVYRLQQKLGNDLSAKEILISAGLVTQKEIQDGTTIKLTADKLKEALATGQLSLENYKLIASIFGVEGANYGATVSFEVLTKAIWKTIVAIGKFLISNPIGWLILAGTAIAGTVALVDALTVSLDEAKENLSNLKDECKNIESELSSMNDELKTTVDRMTELENKDKLSFTEKEEYDNLVKNNNELQRSIDLLELEQKIRNQDKNKAFVQTMDTFNSQIQNGYMGASITQGQHIDIQYIQREEYLKKIEELTADYNKALTDEEKTRINNEINNIKLKIDSINSYFAEKSKELTEISSDISYIRNPSTKEDRTVNEWLDYINDFQDKMAISIGGNNAKTNTFNRIVDNWKFDDIIQGLQDLGKQGQVTADMLNDPKYDEFIQKLVELGVIDSADSLDLIALAFNNFGVAVLDTGEKVENTTKSFSDLKKETESLQETLDNTFSNQSTLQSAFDKIQEGTSLSADEVRKLIELCKGSYPEIATAFTKTADGYTISANDIISANEAITKSTKEELQNQIDEYQKIIDEYNSIKSDPNADRFVVSNLANKASEAKPIIDGLRLVMEMFGLTTKDLDDNYKELMDNTSKLASKAKTLSSAFAEQNENGKLSVDTVLSLIENGYAAALMYDKKTGAIRLNAQAYIDLANAEISAQIAELTLAKSNDKASQEKLEVQREIVSNLGWSYLGTAEAALRMAEAQEKLNNADADLSKYDAQIQALNDLRDNLGDIVNGTYGGSGGSSTDPIKEAFEKEKALRQHWLAMGKDDKGNTYNKDMYYEWLDGEEGYKKYFSDLTKYQEENRQYEEEIYKWRLEQDKELFQEKLDNNEKLINEINNTEYDNPLQKYDEVAKVIQDSIDITQQRINDLIASGSGAVQDEIDSLQDDLDDLNDKLKENEKDRQKEQEDLWKTRVENEKTYWENLKKETEDYYDNRIKELQDIADEEERISKEKELQLKLMKAQDDLLKAKKNRNQLVFSNGGFEYDYDQEAIIKSMEVVADAQKEVNDNIRENEIQALEDKKDEKISGLDDLIKKIDEYIDKLNGKTVPTESDPEILKAVAENSKENEQNKSQNITDFTPVTLESFLQDMGFKYNKEVVSAGYNLYEKVIGNSLSIPNEIAKSFSGTTYNNCTINKGISINNPSFSLIKGVSETKVRDIFDEEITNAFNIISDRIETEAIRVGNE